MVEIGGKIGRKIKGMGRQQSWAGWMNIRALSSPLPALLQARGMDPWQRVPVLSCFLSEQDIFHFTFPQENVSSREKKKKEKVIVVLLLSAVSSSFRLSRFSL